MAAGKKIIDYVKDQLKAGYTPDQIRKALATSGYTKADIEEAMSSAGKIAGKAVSAAAKPQSAASGNTWDMAFIISLVGAVLLIVAAILPLLGLTILSDLFVFFPAIVSLDAFMSMVMGIIFAVIIIAVFMLQAVPENFKGPAVLVVSIIALLMDPGFFLGGILGIIGGALKAIGK